jgi:hypothetical protein
MGSFLDFFKKAKIQKKISRIRGAVVTERDQRRSSGERGLCVSELETQEREGSCDWVVTIE